jgi:hypothetical protein
LRRKTTHSLSCLAAGLLLVSFACSKPAEAPAGSARLSVSLQPSLSSPEVSRVTVILTAADFAARSVDLAQVDGHWAGSFGDVPPGSERTFSAVAFDAQGVQRFTGQVSGVSIVAQEIAAVALVLQEVGEAPSLDNSVPGVQAMLSSVDRIKPGGTLTLEVRAYDPDPADSLSYAWTASAGSFAAPSSAATEWTAPEQAGPVTLTVTVTDTQGASASHSLTVNVGSFPPVVAYTSRGSMTSWGALPLHVAAWDPHQTRMAFIWSVNYGSVDPGGYSYTSSDNSWRAPQCLPAGVAAVVNVVIRNELGLSTTTTFTITEPVATCNPGGWTPALSMNATRFQHTATLLSSGRVLVAGGFTDSWGTGSAELYDPATDTWTLAAEQLVRRQRHTATLLPSGQVLVTGGNTSTGAVASTELYDPATNTWTLAAPMASARHSHVAVGLPSGQVLVTGGSTASSELYDPATNTWTTTGSMSSPRLGHTATLLGNGKVLVVGGTSGNGIYLATAELYDPATGAWSSAGSTSAMRAWHTATVLQSGRVLVTGGTATYNYYGAPQSASAELYDPATHTWTATGSLLTARSGHVAAPLPSGKVLIVGGRDHTGSVTSSELYDPFTGTWSSGPAMSMTRHEPTATALPSGRVLVAGGRLLAYSVRGPEITFPTQKVDLYIP